MPPEPSEGERHESSGPTRPSWLAPLVDLPRGALDWVLAHRVVSGLVAGVCALAVAGAVAFGLLGEGAVGPDTPTLDRAMDALDRGDYEEARRMAEALREGGLRPDDPLGAPSFLLGATAAYEADDAWQAEKEPLNLIAARYLEEARDLGFPPGRQGEGLYLLGRSLYLTGQMAASRIVLRKALEANPRRRTEIHRLLADAFLEDANPKLIEALEHNAIALADPTLGDDDRYQGLIQRAEILLRVGKTSECVETLAQIPPEAEHHVEAVVIRGRVLLSEARAVKHAAEPTEQDGRRALEKYRAAIKTLRLAQAHDTLSAQASRKAMYLIGVCYVEQGDARAALNQFGRTRRKYVRTPEATAAGFQIAELARRLGRDQEALVAYRQTLGTIGDVKQYSNPWLSLDDLRAGLLEARRHYRDAESFETCLELTRLFYPVFSRARMTELVAETYQLWGQSLLARADDLPLGKAAPLASKGRTQLRRAGRTFERLAEHRVTTSHYSDDLWDTAECYLEGQGYKEAVEALQEYLKSRPRRRHPQALVNLGEALLAVGRVDEAIAAFEECIEFHPRDAAGYRARLLAGQAYQEQGDVEAARALLEDNLSGEFLTPDSREWRDSLFSLGRMLHLTGKHEEAILRLEEAVERYPESPQAIEARYLIADSYRRRAKLTEAKLNEDLIESVRLAFSKQIAECLLAALDQYRHARDALSQREKTTELCQTEKSLLRNCCFSIGNALFDLGRDEEAIQAYTLATGRYPNEPATLEAYVQIVRAYHRLGKPGQARRTVEQAKVVLDRVGSQAEYKRTTIHGAEEWRGVLDSLAGL